LPKGKRDPRTSGKEGSDVTTCGKHGSLEDRGPVCEVAAGYRKKQKKRTNSRTRVDGRKKVGRAAAKKTAGTY